MNSRATGTSPEPLESSSLSSSSVHSEDDSSARHRSPSGSHRQILHQIDFLHSLLNTFLPFGGGQRDGSHLSTLPYTERFSMRAPSMHTASMLPLESYFPSRPTHHMGAQELSTARSSGLESYISHAHSIRSQTQAAAAQPALGRRYRATAPHAVAPAFSGGASAVPSAGPRQSLRSAAAASSSAHPSRTKTVYVLNCVYCDHFVCHRGMRAILLADVKIELFSTDCPPSKSVELVEDDYSTPSCACKLRDIACLVCGNVLGYHVTQPCSSCLSACNNGHFWMFHSSHVVPRSRVDSYSRKPLSWTELLALSGEQDARDLYSLLRRARRQAMYRQLSEDALARSLLEPGGEGLRTDDLYFTYERYCR